MRVVKGDSETTSNIPTPHYGVLKEGIELGIDNLFEDLRIEKFPNLAK